MKYDQQIRDTFMNGLREAFKLGLGDSQEEFSETEFEEIFQEIIKDYGGFEQMDRDIDIGVQNGYSVEAQLDLLKSILTNLKVMAKE